jgi:hypothetical protein
VNREAFGSRTVNDALTGIAHKLAGKLRNCRSGELNLGKKRRSSESVNLRKADVMNIEQSVSRCAGEALEDMSEE